MRELLSYHTPEDDTVEDDGGPAPPIAPNDRELLMRFCTRRDEPAFAELVQRHARLVWVVVWQVLRHREDVEDAFQATFLILARRSRSIRSRDSIAAWLHSVAFRTALAVRRRRNGVQQLNGEAGKLIAPVDEQLAEIQRHEERTVLLEELRALPQRYQLPLTLCYLEDRTRSDVADELGCTVAAVKGRLARGKQLLRVRLIRRGVALSTAMAAMAAPLAEAKAVAGSSVLAGLSSVATGGALSGSHVSQTAVQLAKHGAQMMAISAIAKPAAVVILVATLGAATLVADDAPNAKPATTGTAVATSGIDLQVTATDAPQPEPATATFVAKPRVEIRATTGKPAVITAQGVTITQPAVPPNPEPQPTPGRVVAPVAPPRVNPPVVVRTPVPTYAPAEKLSESGRKQLELEKDYWELKLQALRMKSEAEDMRARILEKQVEQGTAPAGQEAESRTARAESLLLQAEAKMAEIEILKLEERLKKAEETAKRPQQETTIFMERENPALYIPLTSQSRSAPQPPIAPPATRSSGRRQPAAWNQPAPQPQPNTIAAGDALKIEAEGIDLGDVTKGDCQVEPMGTVALGPVYGRVEVVGKTVLEAEAEIAKALIRAQLALGFEDPDVKVQVTQEPSTNDRWNAKQSAQESKIAVGEMIQVKCDEPYIDQRGGSRPVLQITPLVAKIVRVEPMGTIALGPRYGRVEVVGKTTLEAEEAVAKAMHQWAHSVGVTDLENIKIQVTRPFAPAGPQSLQAEHIHEIRIKQTPAVAPAPPEEKAPPEASNNAPLEVGEQVVILIRPVSGGSFVKYPVLTRGEIDPFGFLMIGSQKGRFPDSFKVQIGRKTCEEAAKIIQEEVNKVSANPLMGELVVMREQEYVQASDQFLIEQEQKAEEAKANR